MSNNYTFCFGIIFNENKVKECSIISDIVVDFDGNKIWTPTIILKDNDVDNLKIQVLKAVNDFFEKIEDM